MIQFIISWMDCNSQSILSNLPVSCLLLLQNVNDCLSTALLPQRCRRTSAVFRGHTEELCYSSRLTNDCRLIAALNPQGYWINTAMTSSRDDKPSLTFTDDCAFQAVASSPEKPFGIISRLLFSVCSSCGCVSLYMHHCSDVDEVNLC